MRFFTNGLIHNEYYHVIGNCFGLYIVGIIVEEYIGSLAFVLVFGFGIIITSIVFHLRSKYESTVGASPGIYAVIAVILLVCISDADFAAAIRESWTLVSLIGYFIIGNILSPGNAYVHSIGFAFGFVVWYIASLL